MFPFNFWVKTNLFFKKDDPNRTIIDDFREMGCRHFAPPEWAPHFEIFFRNFNANL